MNEKLMTIVIILFVIDLILSVILFRKKSAGNTYSHIQNMGHRYQTGNILFEKDREKDFNLADQVIVEGLSNAYFSVYSVDLQSGRCEAIKVIDFFRQLVKNCHITELVTKAFLNTCVMPEDRKKMREFTDWHTLAERLSEGDATVEEFHGMLSPWEWCRASWIVAARDKDGRARIVLFTVEDITESYNERKQHEQEKEQARKELEKSRAAAEAANKAKTDFLFNMSHDIRTPMNAIIGYANLMEKHFGEVEKCKDYLHKIQNSSGFLLSLINNVLEMARIESGKLVLEEEVCKVSELIDKIISVYADLMEQKQIMFTTNIDVTTEYYYGDQVKLSEVFLNLISNAYKYTKEGGKISLSVNELDCDKKDYIVFQTVIADAGIGMSKEFLPKIFEEFSREYTSTENKIEGTGLGMPIVKRLIDFMGGTIEVESELGNGSTFIVTLPHRIAKAEDVKESTMIEINPKTFFGKRILLVEDNEMNAEIATEILSEAGFVIEHAEDGQICIGMLADKESSYYDLILMDVQMPNMDGYEAARFIRRMKDRTKADIPIIAMTANAFEEDKKNALMAGMNGHLAKPIEVSKLMDTLAQIL